MSEQDAVPQLSPAQLEALRVGLDAAMREVMIAHVERTRRERVERSQRPSRHQCSCPHCAVIG